jgi:hypothetical protein
VAARVHCFQRKMGGGGALGRTTGHPCPSYLAACWVCLCL